MKIQHKRSNQLQGGSAKEPSEEYMEYGELAVNFNEADPAIFLKDSDDNIVRIAGAGSVGNIEIPDSGSDPHQPGTTDDRYVEITGDTMTGQLALPGGGGDTEALQKQEIEALISASDTGSGKYVPLAGGTMTGNLVISNATKTNDSALKKSEIEALISSSDVIVQDGSVSVPDVANYSEGQLWWNSDAEVAKLFVLYNDPSGGGGTDAGGLKWIEASPKPEIPSIFPDLDNGNNQPGTLDDRYLSTEADAGNQTVASTGTTDFAGDVTLGDDKITLDATDGKGTFAGDATINSLTIGRGGGNKTSNSVLGDNAFSKNVSGESNVAIGNLTLINNTEGSQNTAVGSETFKSNTKGSDNTIYGCQAARLNTEGDNNTAIGTQALLYNETGSNNTAVGANAGYWMRGSNNTILGAYQGTGSYASVNDTVIISAGRVERARCDDTGKWIYPDGADFAGGNCEISSDGLLRVKRSAANGSGGLVVYPDNDFSKDATVNIKTDGSADFAGGCTNVNNTGGIEISVKKDINDNGIKLDAGDGGAGNRPGIGIYYDNVRQIFLNGNGTGEFTGGVTSGGYSTVYGADSYAPNMLPAGFYGVINAVGPTFARFPYGTSGATGRNLEVFGGLQINTEPDNDANYTVTTEEYEEQEELTPYVPAVPATYDEEGNELTAEVSAVEATYQTVTKTREIRTYNGPTLDVKAVIQELQQRVADRDAVIADFTTRLAALEADHATLMNNNNGGY